MNSFWRPFFGFIFTLALLPVLFQFALALLIALLPYLIALAVLVGLVAGAVAGGMIRRQVPPPVARGSELPPLSGERVRRPRSPRTH